MQFHTEPKTAAEAAVLARCRQLTEFVWAPVRELPTYTRDKGSFTLPAGVPIKGFPYSSTEKTDQFITENIAIRSFLSAIDNPDSKLYQPGQGQFYACNFGIVCNGLARYALGIPYRVSTAKWETIPGMRRVADHGCYKAEDIRLLDVLYAFGEGRNHVAMITDIVKDEKGNILSIEVSDAIRPSCARRSFTPEAFFEKWSLFHLDRYDYIESAPPVDAQTAALLDNFRQSEKPPHIAVDNGDFSNYRLGEDVLLSTFVEGADEVELISEGEVLESYKVFGHAMVTLAPKRGYYELRLKSTGESVHFAVVGAKTSYEISEGSITVTADPCDENSMIHYMDFRIPGESPRALAKYEVLTEEEKARGVITRKIPEDAGSFKVYYKNAYGVWTHPLTKIR